MLCIGVPTLSSVCLGRFALGQNLVRNQSEFHRTDRCRDLQTQKRLAHLRPGTSVLLDLTKTKGHNNGLCALPSKTCLSITNICFFFGRFKCFETMIQEQIVNDFETICNEERRTKE
jgi:hypothetical protein